LGAVELRNAVAAKYGIGVPATLAFDYPTLAALSDFVAGALPTGPNSGTTDDGATAFPNTSFEADDWDDQQGEEGDTTEIAAKVAGIVMGVLGQAVAADQPLMEVSVKSALNRLIYVFRLRTIGGENEPRASRSSPVVYPCWFSYLPLVVVGKCPWQAIVSVGSDGCSPKDATQTFVCMSSSSHMGSNMSVYILIIYFPGYMGSLHLTT